MQKNAKKYGKCGLVWGNIRKKTVSMFIIYPTLLCRTVIILDKLW